MSDDYYVLSDAEWDWVTPFLRDKDAPSAAALRGYLNDRITERLVAARADEREKGAQAIEAARAGATLASDDTLYALDDAAWLVRGGRL